MNKWGCFNVTVGPTGEIKIFNEYGISVYAYADDQYTIKFSDEENGVAINIPRGTNKWIVNDEKHIAIIAPTIAVPWTSNNMNPISVFIAGRLPTIQGDIINFHTANSGIYFYEEFNIPKGVTQIDSTVSNLLLYPVIGRIRDNYNTAYFKDLYFCLQRQFMPGDKIITENKEEYLALGGWLLFKM